MEISGLGFINTDDYRLSSPLASKNAPSFEQLLERARGASSETRSAASAKTQVDKDDRLYQLCLELETFLVKNLLNGMRNTVQKSGLIEEGFAGKMYEDMLYDEYAKDFTKNANFGLAEMAYRQLKG